MTTAAPSLAKSRAVALPTLPVEPVIASPAPGVDDGDFVNNEEPFEGPAFWQLKDRYIISTVKEGAIIIDQHAAHERILYEETLAHFSGKGCYALTFNLPGTYLQENTRLRLSLGTVGVVAEIRLNGHPVGIHWRPGQEFEIETLARAGENTLEVDVTDEAAARRGVDAVAARHGRLDILIANAGTHHGAPLPKWTLADWRRVMAANLDACFVLAQQASAPMVRRKHGRIVFTGSLTGTLGRPGIHGYAASKAALIGFTLSVARELAGVGVRANAVIPGFMPTRMGRAASARARERACSESVFGRHADAVQASLSGVAASVRVVQAREGKDAADHLAAGCGLEDFEPAKCLFSCFSYIRRIEKQQKQQKQQCRRTPPPSRARMRAMCVYL